MASKLELPNVVRATTPPDGVPLVLLKKNCGVFVTPKASRRRSRLNRSVKRIDLEMAASKLK